MPAAMVTGSFKGMEELKRGIQTRTNQLGIGVEEGLQEAGKFLLQRSNEVAPIETGELIAESGSAADPLKGLQTIVYVYYGPQGSVSYEYAVTQHEFYEKKRTAGRQWKYLESPARQYRDELTKIMQKRIEERMQL